MATVKVTAPEVDGRKLTPAEAKMVLDAKIRQKFRWAVRDLVRDDGNAMQSFDAGAFERIVADIHDDVVSEMRYSDDVRQAVRNGVKNFSVAYIKGVLKKALKGKQVPNPGIIMSAVKAVREVREAVKLPAGLRWCAESCGQEHGGKKLSRKDKKKAKRKGR